MAPDRDILLDAAASVLAANPGASTQHIATGAGVSRATLHRAFSTRETLIAAVCDRMLERLDRTFTACGVDAGDVATAVDLLAGETAELGLAWSLLLVEPAAYGIPRVVDEIGALDRRLEAMVARGQAAGTLRPDLPAKWVAYSFSSQTMAAWWAIHEGFVAPLDAPRLVRTTVLDGIRVDSPR
jgi:AcrR family transcriptional regulator